ncbi:MAG: GIY-YIG nuclease family protein [Nitrososphaerota archaeon]|jgi:excinuclease UvrABC nuclease subunit|nr:GIY-YIG nuclease family protein [Nitrososphaerota archaeon]
MSQPPITDIIDDYKNSACWRKEFFLCPTAWSQYHFSHQWQGNKLEENSIDQIPDSPGIYTLILQPNIAGHPSCSYLVYVGQTVSLRNRFKDYLRKEKRAKGRPKLFMFLNMYDGFVCFYYTLISQDQLNTVEKGLLVAYQPPLNTAIPGKLGKIRRAW